MEYVKLFDRNMAMEWSMEFCVQQAMSFHTVFLLLLSPSFCRSPVEFQVSLLAAHRALTLKLTIELMSFDPLRRQASTRLRAGCE